jgi:cathepsin B
MGIYSLLLGASLAATTMAAPHERFEAVPRTRGDDELLNDKQRQEIVQRFAKKSGWEAAASPRFDGMTLGDVKKMMGTHPGKALAGEPLPQSHYDEITDVPDSFDARTQWPGLILPIRNQEQCGSCWAFSAAEVLGDRFSIASGKPGSPVLSAQDMVSCDTGDMGCQGGFLPHAWSYLQTSGIVENTCFPYASGTGVAPKCPNKCAPSSNMTWTSEKHFASSSYPIHGVANMQKEIMTNGPIQVAFLVYESFMSYKSGVYWKSWYEFKPLGGHAVKIIGWGTENGDPYWLVANSWGESWGLDGFFKIYRGDDQCEIESAGPPYAGAIRPFKA